MESSVVFPRLLFYSLKVDCFVFCISVLCCCWDNDHFKYNTHCKIFPQWLLFSKILGGYTRYTVLGTLSYVEPNHDLTYWLHALSYNLLSLRQYIFKSRRLTLTLINISKIGMLRMVLGCSFFLLINYFSVLYSVVAVDSTKSQYKHTWQT